MYVDQTWWTYNFILIAYVTVFILFFFMKTGEIQVQFSKKSIFLKKTVHNETIQIKQTKINFRNIRQTYF